MIEKAAKNSGLKYYPRGCKVDSNSMNALYKTLSISLTWSPSRDLICKCSFNTDLSVTITSGRLHNIVREAGKRADSLGSAVGVVAKPAGAFIGGVHGVFSDSEFEIVSAREILESIQSVTKPYIPFISTEKILYTFS